MKVSVTQDNLSRALGAVGRVVSGRSSLPILANTLLVVEDNRLRLSATNLEIGINYWVVGKIDEPGSLTVPARLFTDFVSSLPGGGTVELSSKDANLTVKSEHYHSQINGIAADEFPIVPHIEGEPRLTIEANLFREALAQVVIAASLDEARPVLAGVRLHIEDGRLYIVATDSYRLAERQVTLEVVPQAGLSIIVPARTIQELIRLLGEAEGEIDVFLDDNQVMFRVDHVELVSRLIEGQFPPYQQVIPTTAECEIELPTAEFSRLAKVAGLFARESAGSIKLEIQAEGELTISSNDSEVGAGRSSAECEVRGDDGEVSLNARYLGDALSAIKTPRVTFTLSGKLSACVLRPVGEGEDDYLHIVMPLRT